MPERSSLYKYRYRYLSLPSEYINPTQIPRTRWRKPRRELFAMDKRVDDAIAILGRVTAPVNAPAPAKVARKRTRLERLVDEHTAPAAPPARPPRHDPWRRDQYLARLATFARARDWFAKPDSVSPTVCARHGWQLARCNTLSCPSCGAHVSFTASLANVQFPVDVEVLARPFIVGLRAAHLDACPWRRWRCPADFSSASALAPHTLLASLALGVARAPGGAGGGPASEAFHSSPEARTAGRAAAALAAALATGGAPLAPVTVPSGAAVSEAVDAAAALLSALASRLTASALAIPGAPAAAGARIPHRAALQALFGWEAMHGAAGVPPSLRCALCDATYTVPAPGAATPALAASAQSSAPEAPSVPQTMSNDSSAVGSAGFMSAARRALSAASRAWAAIRASSAAGAAPVPPPDASAAPALPLSSAAAPVEPLIECHRWYCPVVRSSALPAALLPVAARLADTSAALARQLESDRAQPRSLGTTADAREATAADARDSALRRRHEIEDALRRAVAAGLASLSRATLAVVDEGAMTGLRWRPGAASADAVGEEPLSSNFCIDDDEQLEPPAPRVPGWLLTTLAILHAAMVCSTPSGGDVLPF